MEVWICDHLSVASSYILPNAQWKGASPHDGTHPQQQAFNTVQTYFGGVFWALL
jgi:hypothetical protein